MESLDECFDIFLRDKADRFVDFLAVLEDYEGRDAHDAELCGELLLLIDVDLADFHFTVRSGDFIDEWGEHAAGAAPWCPEIDKYCAFGIEDFGLEIFIGDGDCFHEIPPR